MKRFIVTGCAGFIGSNLTERLLSLGHDVVGMDNFSTGCLDFLPKHPNFQYQELDLLHECFHSNLQYLQHTYGDTDCVFHLAANADVRRGTEHPMKDVEQNIVATARLLDAMRVLKKPKIVFTSTGSVYGETSAMPTPEFAPFPIQTSLYGASKLACEGLIAAYCEGFGFVGRSLRLVSVLGKHYTHGHVVDFFKQLREHPDRLNILGDGEQRKSYIHVDDVVDALILASESENWYDVLNVGTDETISVKGSARWISRYMEIPEPEMICSGGKRGWVGDVPKIQLDCTRLRSLGWRPKNNIVDGIRDTVVYLIQEEKKCGLPLSDVGQ